MARKINSQPKKDLQMFEVRKDSFQLRVLPPTGPHDTLCHMASNETSSGLFIGFRDGPLVAKSDTLPSHLKENFIGGSVKYPLPECHLKSDMFNCKGCGVKMCLLLHLYCPVKDDEDRFIHVFACCNSTCTSAKWLVTRTVVPFFDVESSCSKKEPADVPSDTKKDEWFDDEDDWSVPGVCSESEKITSPASDAIHREPVITKLSEELTGFKAFYISVEEDSDLNDCSKTGPPIGNVEVTENDSGECYEKSTIPGVKDELTSKFWKKLNKMPHQIIRYNLNGSPLLNRTVDSLDKLLQPCSACGSKRIFEFQLMPALVSILKPCKRKVTPPEFATVLIFTCSKDCSSNQAVTEQAILLEDPDASLVESKIKKTVDS